jgi:hypothetical protein
MAKKKSTKRLKKTKKKPAKKLLKGHWEHGPGA